MNSEFKIKKICIDCDTEIKTIYDIGFSDYGLFICRSCKDSKQEIVDKK